MFEQISIDFFSLGIGGLIGLLLGAVIVGLRVSSLSREKAALEARMEAEKASMDDHFTALASRVLESNAQSFLNIAQEKLRAANNDSANDLDKRTAAIEQMVKPVEKHLQQLGGAVKELHGTKQNILDDLRNLNKETSKLAGALRNPSARGNWGEEMLERLLENSGLIKGVNYQLQESMTLEDGKKLRPDAVVNLPDSLHIVIDSKAPINDFVRNLDSDMEEGDYRELQTGLAASVKNHIRDLGKKSYWENLDSPDFVVLFLPSEHLFSAAVQADPSLLDQAAERKVVMASPTILMSLLRVVAMSWRQVELAKNAQDIAALGSDLYERIATFGGHIQKIGKGIESAMGAYDKAISSLETRVLPSARSLKEKHVSLKNTDLPKFEPIGRSAKALSAPDFAILKEEQNKKASNQ